MDNSTLRTSPMPIIGNRRTNSPVEPPSSVVHTPTWTWENSRAKPAPGWVVQAVNAELPPSTVESPVPPPSTTTRAFAGAGPKTRG